MTILAGIFSRKKEQHISEMVCEELKLIISRNPRDEILTFKDDRVFLAKVDIGIYGESAIHVDLNKSVSMLAGEPLLDINDGSLYRTRTQDLNIIHHACEHRDWDFLKKAQGVFCSVYYNVSEGRLNLIADKLCIRPLYYWISENYVVFATAIRILEELSIVPKIMDLRGVTEIASLGYSLGVRTPYTNIFLLKAAEIVEFCNKSVSRSQYWRWDKITVSNQSIDILLRESYKHFKNAISKRIRSDTSTIAFLSGGLDSRCVVTMLRDKKVKVYTFNFSHSGTQDQVFAQKFAEKIGTIHTNMPYDEGNSFSMMISSILNESKYHNDCSINRPNLVWSGDGGSVGVGHVYLNQTIKNLMRDGKKAHAINAFLNQQKLAIVKGLLKSHIANSLSGILEQGISEELDDIHCDDPGRGFHIFLLLNDQRRHLSQHFEDIDLHRIEFHLPFYDGNFLTSILRVPIDFCLNHYFYVKWLNLFPTVVISVPWQFYPGHEPCPLPIPKGLRYQWNHNHFKEQNNMKKRLLVQKAVELLRQKDFPYDILNKEKFRLATWIYNLGLRDYSYVIKTASTYYKYWTLCNGKYSLGF